jgi:hypothetical protein
MSGVYNRKLFRKSSARDELRRMGGIMASSEELMAEAMKTAQQAPRPSGLGSMAMPAPQAPMPMQQPMMGMPMMGMPMQQPMMAQPMGMPMQQPMMGQPFMPPQVPQSVQMQPAGFNEGGEVSAKNYLPPWMRKPAAETEEDSNFVAGAGTKIGAVDIGAPAGTYTPAQSEDSRIRIFRKAEELADSVDELDPETVSEEILTTSAAEGGPEQTGDPRTDLAALYESMTGDPAAYEKNIDALNRGIIGAAIAAGTSARATENIARGMLVGLEGVKATEERRAGDARALQLAAIEARAAEAKAAAEETKALSRAEAAAELKRQEDMRKVYTDTFNSIIEAGVDKVTVPDGMSIEEYARNIAKQQVEEVFGSQAAPSSTPGTKPTLEQFLAAAKVNNPNATEQQLTEFYKKKYGG